MNEIIRFFRSKKLIHIETSARGDTDYLDIHQTRIIVLRNPAKSISNPINNVVGEVISSKSLVARILEIEALNAELDAKKLIQLRTKEIIRDDKGKKIKVLKGEVDINNAGLMEDEKRELGKVASKLQNYNKVLHSYKIRKRALLGKELDEKGNDRYIFGDYETLKKFKCFASYTIVKDKGNQELLGGRIYTTRFGHLCKRVNKRERSTLEFSQHDTFNKTVEIDFSNLHFKMLYALLGINYQGDCYDLTKQIKRLKKFKRLAEQNNNQATIILKNIREVSKLCCLIMINCRPARVTNALRMKLEQECNQHLKETLEILGLSARKLHRALKEKHKKLNCFFQREHNGLRCQKLDEI